MPPEYKIRRSENRYHPFVRGKMGGLIGVKVKLETAREGLFDMSVALFL